MSLHLLTHLPLTPSLPLHRHGEVVSRAEGVRRRASDDATVATGAVQAAGTEAALTTTDKEACYMCIICECNDRTSLSVYK